MDITELIEKMDEEEKEVFEKENASKYFQYICNVEQFKKIKEKIQEEKELKEEEWEYLFYKFFILSCKSLWEEESLKITDKALFLFCRIGLKLSKKNSFYYNECYKMIEFLESIIEEKNINKDLFYGLRMLGKENSKKNFEILLEQHQEASTFRNQKNNFIEAYKESKEGIISSKERIAINCFNRTYLREKELIKKYEIS